MNIFRVSDQVFSVIEKREDMIIDNMLFSRSFDGTFKKQL